MSLTQDFLKSITEGAKIVNPAQPWISEARYGGEVIHKPRSKNDPAPWVLLASWETGDPDPWRFRSTELHVTWPEQEAVKNLAESV